MFYYKYQLISKMVPKVKKTSKKKNKTSNMRHLIDIQIGLLKLFRKNLHETY